MAKYVDWQSNPEVALRKLVVEQMDRVNRLLSQEVVPSGAIGALDAVCSSFLEDDDQFQKDRDALDVEFGGSEDRAPRLDDDESAARYWRALYKRMARAITERGVLSAPVGVEYVAQSTGLEALEEQLAGAE